MKNNRHARDSSDHERLAKMSAQRLVDVIDMVVAVMARCDSDGIAMPSDFIAHFGVVRHCLMRKCVGPDYSERQFREFFKIVIQAACEQHRATPARIETLQAMNQLTQ